MEGRGAGAKVVEPDLAPSTADRLDDLVDRRQVMSFCGLGQLEREPVANRLRTVEHLEQGGYEDPVLERPAGQVDGKGEGRRSGLEERDRAPADREIELVDQVERFGEIQQPGGR